MIYAIKACFSPGRPQPPNRDAKYLAWIRKFPCCACGSARNIEAAHTGPHGLGQKADDYKTLPMCLECHRTGKHAYHKIGRIDWEAVQEKSVEELISFYQRLWKLKRGKAA